MENNQAFVAILDNLRAIEGADNIISADVTLNGVKVTQIVTGKDTKLGTRVVYFDSNMCINPDVIETIDKKSPGYGSEDFKSLGLYLGKNGRVRVVKLRGVISNGLAVGVEKFYPFVSNVREQEELQYHEGYSFTKLGNTEICHKYEVPKKQISIPGKKGKIVKKESRIIPGQFHFHIDTSKLITNIHVLNPNQVISISRKIHGTSAIVSNCLVKRKLSPIENLLKFFRVPIINTEYAYVYASRTVIKNEALGEGFYNVDLWSKVGEDLFKYKLHRGETVYYEIVGYLPGTSLMIQKDYDYGCKVGEYKIAVYRITATTADGTVIEYGWEAIKERCKELNVPMVEEYFFGKAHELLPVLKPSDSWNSDFVSYLKNTYLEKDTTDCIKKVPDEGIVLRIEGLNINVYKLKSEKFLLKESKEAENGDLSVEDTQEA